MREILFRGKRADNGEWVYGCLISIEASNIKTTDGKINQRVCCITKPYIPNDADGFDLALYRVIPETVGQYTGLTDKNGTKIFEGDILLVDEGETYEMRVTAEMQSGCWLIFEGKNNRGFLAIATKHSKVIGNIHDNPELLKEGEG